METIDFHKPLVKRCQQGDRKAQFLLYKAYSKAMFNICLRMLKNKSDAEDILQNAFIDVFQKIKTFRFESSVGSWIKRITINNCINFLKKKRIEFDQINETIIDKLTSEKAPQENQQYNVQLINKAIQQLPNGYRVVLSLYLLEGFDHAEIAQILNISKATSKSQYSRARARLRQIIDLQNQISLT